MLKKFYNFLISALFPTNCVGCEKENELLCKACFDSLILNNAFKCAECGRRLPEMKKTCHKNAPFILAAAGSYKNDALRKLIWLLKYRGYKTAAKPIADILSRYIKNLNLPTEKYKLISVPLHPDRKKERGFNQSELIAEELIKNNIFNKESFFINAVKRTKNNPPQAKIKDWQLRKENIEKSFRVSKSNIFKNQPVIIIDDVSTSGATLREIALTIKKAGARKIIGLVLAKG